MEDRIVTQCDQTNWQIVTLGNPDTEWRLVANDKAIEHIEEGRYTYYAQKPSGETIPISVIESNGHKFLRTERDLTKIEPMLDFLPQCSTHC